MSVNIKLTDTLVESILKKKTVLVASFLLKWLLADLSENMHIKFGCVLPIRHSLKEEVMWILRHDTQSSYTSYITQYGHHEQ